MNNVGKIATAQRVIAGLMSLILGKKSTVEWGRSASCGESGVIGLPRPKTGEADEIALLTRLAVHEAGHVEHSDFDCIEGLDGNVKALMNALEDPRIELEQVKTFPGAALILNRGLEDSIRVVDSMLDADNPSHSADLVTVNVLLKGYRKLVPHQAIKASADGLVAKGNQILGDAGVAAVDQAIGQLVGCVNTAGAVTLARELWQALQPPEPEQQETQQSGSPDQQQQDKSEADNGGEDKQDGAGEVDKTKEQQPGDASEDAGSPDAEDEPDAASPEGDSAGGESPKSDAADGESGGGPGGDGNGDDESRSDASDAAGDENQLASGKAGESGGGDFQSNTPEAAIGNSEPGHGEQEDGSQEQGVNGNPSPGAHNQESSDAGNGCNSQDSQKSEVGQGKRGGNGKLDLNSAKGTDLGSLLVKAYELKFGEPDVDAPGLAMAAEKTTATDEFTQLVAAALERAADDGESLERALELIEVALDAGGGNATGKVSVLDATANLNGAVSRLVRIFTKELQDKRRRNVKLAPAGGHVASNRVWRLKSLGDTNVFKVTTSTCGIDAAVMVFLDRSASMRTCIIDAAKAALACSQALERISKVKTAVEMFPGYAGDIGNTVTLQAFGQSARQVVKRVSEVDAEGGTPLAEALREAIPKLLAQRVKKRIAFLITDGIPNDRVMALDEIEKAETQGVEFVGIGIGEYGKAIEGLTPFSVCINEASELPDAFEKLFRGNIALKLVA